MKRALTLAIILSLTGLGPVPLSACALFSSKIAECATPETQLRCDQMDMDASGPQITAPLDSSCCIVSQAPLPESRFHPTNTLLLAAPVIVSDAFIKLPPTESESAAEVVQDLSPPPLQTLLCTFLI